MVEILYLGKTQKQIESLPGDVRDSLEWALGQLEEAPDRLPEDRGRGIHSKSLDGPPGLFRIAVRSSASDPGYRAVGYREEGGTILILRVVRRDSTTYVGLRRVLRLVRERQRERSKVQP